MGTLAQDIRFALRNLRRIPAFPLAAIATLALGIGATTAIFSAVSAVLLRPLPYPDPGDLYALRTTLTDGRVTTGLVAASELVRLNDPLLSIERAAGYTAQNVTLLRDDGVPIKTRAYAVSEGFFDLFGLPMTMGGFTAEHHAPGGPPPIVISTRIWRDVYDADPDIIGKPIRFAEVATTIVGVAPEAFDMPADADFWAAVPLDPNGVGHNFDAVMRIEPGASLEQVESEMAAVMAGVARDFPASANARAYVVRPLVESIVGDLGPILIIVLSATGLLLGLACVNFTNLLLARGAARGREMAVRVALGAGRWRIVRQLLTESVMLAAAGGLVGVTVGYAGVQALLALGASQLPRLDAIAFDGPVLLFALVTLVTSGIVVGFAPALRLARTDVTVLMNESGRSGGSGRATARWLGVLTVAEVALAVLLVAGAGWLIQGFASLRAVDLGFEPERRVTLDVTLLGERYPNPAAVAVAARGLLDELRALPGVEAAGATFNVPLRGTPEASLFIELPGEPLDPLNPLQSRQRVVSPGYFDAIGTRLVAGRDFSYDDRPGTPAVVVVNETFVRRNLPGRDPLGARFRSGYPAINPDSEVEVVGVVEDVRQRSLTEEPEPSFYASLSQIVIPRQTIVLRTAGAVAATLRAPIADVVRRMDPQIAVDVRPLDDEVAGYTRRQELGMTLMLVFGVAAVALAAIGIYGVVAYSAAQRRAEMATRLALGASPRSVFWLVFRRGVLMAGVGTALGLAAAYASGRLVASRLYQVDPTDPWLLAAATGIVVLVVFVTTAVPAWRAARLSPAGVLRTD
jgi:putative ABC transport system permease protein